MKVTQRKLKVSYNRMIFVPFVISHMSQNIGEIRPKAVTTYPQNFHYYILRGKGQPSTVFKVHTSTRNEF